MSTRPWYKRYPADFIAGTLQMSLEEKGAYSMVLDLIYDRGGAIPDDSKWIARVCGCSTRKWNSIRARLISLGKIHAESGELTNARAAIQLRTEEKEHENLAKNARKLAESRVNMKDKIAEKTTGSHENNDLAQNRHGEGHQHTRSQKPDTRKKAASNTELDAPKTEPPPDAAEPDEFKTERAIIEAFDDERKRVFGDSQARPWPAATDLTDARRMVAGGATAALCRAVFSGVFERQNAGGKQPAGSLRYMRNPVAEAVTDGLLDIPENMKRGDLKPYRPKYMTPEQLADWEADHGDHQPDQLREA